MNGSRRPSSWASSSPPSKSRSSNSGQDFVRSHCRHAQRGTTPAHVLNKQPPAVRGHNLTRRLRITFVALAQISFGRLDLLRPQGRRRSIARQVLPAPADHPRVACSRSISLCGPGSERRDCFGTGVPIQAETSRTYCFVPVV